MAHEHLLPVGREFFRLMPGFLVVIVNRLIIIPPAVPKVVWQARGPFVYPIS